MRTVLGRLALSRDWLTTDQPFATAELLRDVADALDRGRLLAPHPSAQPVWWPRHWLVKSTKRDFDGRPLFRVISWP